MSFFAQSKFVWKNGEIIPWSDATIHMSAHGLHYGTGVFEGIRCYNTVYGPAVYRLDAHLERMFESARMYGLPIPYSQEDLTKGALELVDGQRFPRLLPAAHRVLRQRKLGRSSAQLPG